jgi:hypothetical protein
LMQYSESENGDADLGHISFRSRLQKLSTR